ncbi:BsuBI/PstI family type II restriction endonuclease (plasmid) [Paracoccus marcusii]|jgi:hypothetical protein|uniref:BsuBI/PstI family type II restriction endonuclease n=1 Tax=Paracoccus marcusii TaxID=59779 RepID=UPI0038BBA25D
MPDFPPYATKAIIAERLPIIFPDGIDNRIYCTRDMAASTVFAMIYVGAVEGAGRYLGPVHVYRMSNEQAAMATVEARQAYANGVVRGQYVVPGTRWYADNSREPIRDETLREGLVAVGAVLARTDLPTTSGRPRYALKGSFAKLFDPALDGEELERAIVDFQKTSLSRSALARVSIMLSGAAAGGDGVQVTFPNRETRQMAPGPSSLISRAVVEVFAPRFMANPVVLWLSESGNKVVARDDKLAARIGLKIEADKNLPDLILADLGPADPILLFVEVVATDGAVSDRRKVAILELTDAAGFDRKHIKFLSAYQDRGTGGFKKTVQSLAWGSMAWFASEPHHIITLHDATEFPTRAMPD